VNRISPLVSALCRHQVFVLGPWAVYELSLMKALVYFTQKARFYSIAAKLVCYAHHIIFQIAGATYARSRMKSKTVRQRPEGTKFFSSIKLLTRRPGCMLNSFTRPTVGSSPYAC